MGLKDDLLTDEYKQAYVYLHELSHTRLQEHGNKPSPFTESFAIMNASKPLNCMAEAPGPIICMRGFLTSETKVLIWKT